jgi:anti-sigma B factor antagonist
MELTVENYESDILRVALKGRMDIAGTERISRKLTRLITTADNMKVILNLSEVDFMESIGIGTIITVAKAVRRQNGRLVLLNPKPIVDTVLRTTDIDKLIPIFYELNEAREALLD